jgi:hypothetical protein
MIQCPHEIHPQSLTYKRCDTGYPPYERLQDRGRGLQGSGYATQLILFLTDHNPDALAEAQELIDACNREQLGLILLTKNRGVR